MASTSRQNYETTLSDIQNHHFFKCFFSIFSPIVVSTDDSVLSQMIPLTEEKVLEMIEAAYPNPLSLPDIGAYVQEHNANKLLCARVFMSIFH